MTTFEYLSVAYTLILSLAVVRVLSGVPHALRPGRRYWVHVSWVFFAVALCLTAFWAFLSYREVEWTLLRFIAVLASPALIYTYSSLVIPSDPSTIASWRDYFFDVRIPLFSTGAIFMVIANLSNYALLGVPLLSVQNWTGWSIAAVQAIGLASAKPQLHVILALGPPLLFPFTVLLLGQPGTLAP